MHGEACHGLTVKRLTVPEWFELIDAIHAAGLYSFTVRRVLQRLERGEITIKQAVRYISLCCSK